MVSFEQSLPERFRMQVRKHPRRLAIEAGNHALSYAELEGAVNAVVRVLLAQADGRAQRVVLLVDQGIPAVIATLGALSAGAAYVPLDPALPAARLRELVEEVEPAWIIANECYLALAHGVHADPRRILCIEAIASDGGGAPVPEIAIAPDALAYIYFTSGSTGKPKGVCDSHRNVLHNIWRYTKKLHFDSEDRMTLLQAPHFSGAVSSMFGALLNGAACFPYDVRREGLEPMGGWLRARRITILHAVPAIFREVLAGGHFPALRCVRLEGDRASSRDIDLFRRHCAAGSILANGLGATECGLARQWRIDATTPIPDGPVPIGDAVDDMQVRLLDERGQDVAEGEIGEIAIRSRYLALGYWRRPELTASRFLANPDEPALRTYLTGDLGRMLPDGTLQYLGRKDLQPKLRGQWVDTDAVERVLLGFDGVREAVVSIRQDPNRAPRLVAYLVPRPEAELRVEPIRKHALAHLPVAMVPASWVVMQALPLNANLKVDHGALPAPASGDAPIFVAPRNALERQIETIWREVLGLDSIGIHDDLFALGADSIHVTRVRNRLIAAFSVDLPFATFFDRPSIAGLAEEVGCRVPR